eukprot:6458242-Amphidinium_carterae.5
MVVPEEELMQATTPRTTAKLRRTCSEDYKDPQFDSLNDNAVGFSHRSLFSRMFFISEVSRVIHAYYPITSIMFTRYSGYSASRSTFLTIALSWVTTSQRI